MTNPCDRCFKPETEGEHGVGVCPYEPRKRFATVIDDQLPGGPQMLENLGSTPVYCETKSQLRAEMAARGLRQSVQHVGEKGSDRSKHTTRWI
jgi:hypothetical protein